MHSLTYLLVALSLICANPTLAEDEPGPETLTLDRAPRIWEAGWTFGLDPTQTLLEEAGDPSRKSRIFCLRCSGNTLTDVSGFLFVEIDLAYSPGRPCPDQAPSGAIFVGCPVN